MKRNILPVMMLLLSALSGFAQKDTLKTERAPYTGIVFNVNDGAKLKLSFLNQLWVRYTDVNPGSTVFGNEVDQVWDIGLRRTRLVLDGHVDENVYVFVQFGMNNFSYSSSRKSEFFFHDVVGDYSLCNSFTVGGGLTAWGGFSRFSAPSVGGIMGIDAPLVAQATNDANDQFVRRLSVYAKGDLEKFHYRIAVSKPLAIERSSQYSGPSIYSSYAESNGSPQIHGYVKFDFLDKESHHNPYYKGTYHGAKKVLNIGAGFMFQNDAMHHLDIEGETNYTDLVIFSADAFYDAKCSNDGVINAYVAYLNYDFGPSYIRNVGAMNPANGNSDPLLLNGAGSAFPMIGNGSTMYIQGGYVFPKTIGERMKVMPYASGQFSDYDILEDAMVYTDAGVNFLIDGHRIKWTLAYQNRPIFVYGTEGTASLTERKGLFAMQFQWKI